MLEKRISDLEIKFSHQDYLLEELNKIVSNQQLTIEKLQLEILELKISGTNSSDGSSRNLADDVPPHY
jgi:SlyX protein